jgi:membrane protein DedA with SNARE-associated domain
MADFIHTLLSQLGYLGVALLMLAETVFPPIPSELIMPLAGMQAARGGLSLAGVVVAGGAGAMTGNIFWYWLGRAIGPDRFRGFVERRGRWLTLSWREVERGERLFQRGGGAFVLLGRLIPTIRSVVSIPAGLLLMPFGRFLVWSTIGTMLWTALLAGAGAALGARYGLVERLVSPVSTVVAIALVVAYIWRVATWRTESGAPAKTHKP